MNKKRNVLICIVLILLFLPIISFSTSLIEKTMITTVEINNVDELSNAIASQKSNQIWKIKEGTYDLTENDLNKYKDWKNPETSSQGNWYFPIHENNITLIGEGDVTITSSVETANGAWATQDFLSIWGDNIIIDNIDFKSKKSQNKAIEIMGKNFVLKNSTIKDVIYDSSPNGRVFSGSIYFNPLNDEKDIGKCSLENVYIFSYISASQAKKGNIDVSNLTLNFTNSVWSEWGEGYGPSLIGNVYEKTNNITYIVDNNAIWNELVSNDYIYYEDTKPGTIIKLSEDIKLDKPLIITRSDITIDFNSHKLLPTNNFSNSRNDQDNLLMLDNISNVKIKNGTVETNSNTKNGIYISNSQGITLENMIINNINSKLGGIPLSINNSNTNIKGNLELIVNNNHTHGININSSNGNSSLIFEDKSYISIKGKDILTVINLEGTKENINISGATNAGLEIDENGNFIKHNHTFSDLWNYDENYHWKECSCGEVVDKSNHIFLWKIDKESTTTSKGLKHEECSICGYKKDEVEIPIVGILNESNEEENKNITSTNKNDNNNSTKDNYEDNNETNNETNNVINNDNSSQNFITEEENINLEDEKEYNEKAIVYNVNRLIIGICFIIIFIVIFIIIIKNYKKNKDDKKY